MVIEQISGNTWCVADKSVTVPFYRLDENRVVLLDSGLDTEPYVSEFVRLMEPFSVAAIIATHAHPDHLGTIQHYQNLGAKIYMPGFEAGCMESAPNLKSWYSLFCLTEIEKYFSHIIFDADYRLDKSCDRLTIEGNTFGILHAPGHTMDQICVMTPDHVLYLADALLSLHECQRAKLPYTFSHRLDHQTWEMLGNIEADSYVLAHGGMAPDLKELIGMNEKCFSDCAAKILDLICQPMTFEQLLEKVIINFGLRQNASVYVFRVYERNLKSFVEYLCDIGKLVPRVKDARLCYVKVEEN